MGKIIEKDITTLDALDITTWYKVNRENEKTRGKFDNFSFKTQWILKKNITKLGEIAKTFQEFQKEKEEIIKEKYFGEERSYETTEDEDGKVLETAIRKVKDEYIDEYQTDIRQLEDDIKTLLFETSKVAIEMIDFDSEFDKLCDSEDFTMDDIEILNFMIEQ